MNIAIEAGKGKGQKQTHTQCPHAGLIGGSVCVCPWCDVTVCVCVCVCVYVCVRRGCGDPEGVECHWEKEGEGTSFTLQ